MLSTDRFISFALAIAFTPLSVVTAAIASTHARRAGKSSEHPRGARHIKMSGGARDEYQDVTSIRSPVGEREHGSQHAECSRCCHLWSLAHQDPIEVVLYRDREDLVQGLAIDCWFCQCLRERGYLAGSQPGVFCTVLLCQYTKQDTRVAVVTERSETNEELRSDLEFSMWETADFEAFAPQCTTRSLASWQYIKQRIQNCQSHHPLCQSTSAWLPKRLVEISLATESPHEAKDDPGGIAARLDDISLADKHHPGARNDCEGIEAHPPSLEETQAVRLRVVETSSCELGRPFATLSHRWGQTSTLKLTNTNFDEYTSAVPSHLLPQTYRDAAAVVRRLGVQYIWIDSLCILQDSQEDWLQESSTMDKVYENAFCNIAASSASGQSQGLFFDRDGVLVFPCSANFKREDGTVTQFGCCTEFQRDIFARLDREPLNKRGWALQERLLATRNISFTDTCIYYECSEELGCEIGMPHSLPDICYPGFRYMRSGRVLNKPRAPDSIRNIQATDPWLQWINIVEHYTQSHLTYPGDRLVAISGLARWFQPSFGGRYLAGVWAHNLHKSLAWGPNLAVSPPAAPTPPLPAAAWHAPSWSWAGAPGPSQYMEDRPRHGYRSLITLAGADIAPRGPDDFGMLKHARLCLRAFLLVVRPRDAGRPGPPFYYRFENVFGDADGVRRCSIEFDHADLVPAGWPSSPSSAVVYAMPLLHINSVFNNHGFSVLFLLLVPAASDTEDDVVFRRVGRMKMFTAPPSTVASHDYDPDLPCSSVPPVDDWFRSLGHEYAPPGPGPGVDGRLLVTLV